MRLSIGWSHTDPTSRTCLVDRVTRAGYIRRVLRIHTADRLLPLTDDLANLLSTPPPDPMTREWIATPSKAMQRWLSLRLARQLGIAANIENAFPGSLLARVFEADQLATAGSAYSTDTNPWEVESLTWALLEVIDQHADDPMLSRLADPVSSVAGSSIAGSSIARSRYARVRRIADLFDRYNLHRPAMIRQWADGHDTNGHGQQLPSSHIWQPHLWRQLRAHIGSAGPAERMPGILTRLGTGELRLDLPERLVMFGLTVVPGGPEFIPLAQAVAAHHDLHLYLVEPSSAQVDRVVHPLLESWGRPAIDTAQILATAELDLGIKAQRHPSSPGPTTSLLESLQADIRGNSAPAGSRVFDRGDRSVQLHACYGATRQVEALRDTVLGLLASDPTLSEDDIVVLTPSLERFAPLVEAVLGPSADDPEASGPTTLRYRVADRSILSSNPMLAAASQLLNLATGRFEVTEVVDFLGLAPVRQRYRLTQEELSSLTAWADSTNVRWGLDPRHRERNGVPASVDTNTWQSSLDRLLLGSTVVADGPVLTIGEVAPEGIEGSDTDLVGRLAEVIHQLSWLSEETTSSKSIGEWLEVLLAASRGLFAAPADQTWQADSLHRVAAEISDHSRVLGRPSTTPLTFDDFRRVVGGRIEAKSGRPDFFRGGITISSLRPLRWLPHRVICLLGLEQSAFGGHVLDGDDLVGAAPQLGDHDTRGEAKQALLEAALSADQHLLVFRDGHDIRTNEQVPRATVVDELLDTLTSMFDQDQHIGFREDFEIEHPRQPFDERYFTPGELVHEVAAGFDPDAFSGAKARRARLTSTKATEPRATDSSGHELARSTAAPGQVIQIAELHNFLINPTKHFTSHELQIKLPAISEDPSSLLPIDLTGLDRWKLGDLMIDAAFADPHRPVDDLIQQATAVERRKGSVPPAELGDRAVEVVRGVADQVIEAALSAGVSRPYIDDYSVDITLPDGTRLVGAVPLRLQADAPGPAQVQYSTWKAQHLVEVWLDLMCLVATDPTTNWRALTVNPVKAGEPLGAEVWQISPAETKQSGRFAAAVRSLEVVVDCLRRGTNEAIPLFPQVSRGLYLESIDHDSTLSEPGTLANKFNLSNAWYSSFTGRGDRTDPETELFYRDVSLDDLRLIEALDHDPEGDGGRAGRFARHLWRTIDETIRLSSPAGEIR